ncbi:MAG: hypothetical protein QXI16_00735 [Sulfolobaceae archaeon]
MKPISQEQSIDKLINAVTGSKFSEYDDYYTLEDLIGDIRVTYTFMPIDTILARLAYLVKTGNYTKRFYGIRVYHKDLIEKIGTLQDDVVNNYHRNRDIAIYASPKIYYLKIIRYGGPKPS